MEARIAIALLRNRRVRATLVTAVMSVVLLPALVAAGVVAVIDQQTEATCDHAAGSVERPAGGGAPAQGLYAQPLQLQPGRTYEVGATEYGGPGDPSSGDYGSIPDPGQSYLPSHPDSFAELSVLTWNPANGGTYTFADADALGNLPYLTALRVSHGGHESLLYKRDIGYGQGPGQFIANGQPYRLDVWWQAAQTLGITKSPVQVRLAPATGAAGTLGALSSSGEASAGVVAEATSECAGLQATSEIPLPLVPGTQTKILPSGLAAAGREAPQAVKEMVAAGNRLFGAAYLYGGGHGTSLNTLQPAYDCSSAVSYVLHWGGALGTSALDSTGLSSYGRPGPGRYVSIYANAAHVFMYVGGLRFDTVEDPAYDSGPNSGKPGPKWRVSPSVPDWATWTVRHPPGL
ncbi:MAG: hypothetical protein ACYDA6_04820 [Solirubrobacteraceae bacterium]